MLRMLRKLDFAIRNIVQNDEFSLEILLKYLLHASEIYQDYCNSVFFSSSSTSLSLPLPLLAVLFILSMRSCCVALLHVKKAVFNKIYIHSCVSTTELSIVPNFMLFLLISMLAVFTINSLDFRTKHTHTQNIFSFVFFFFSSLFFAENKTKWSFSYTLFISFSICLKWLHFPILCAQLYHLKYK